MTDEDRSAQQLAAINENMAGLFADYCQRIASPDLMELLAAYRAQRLNLVLTVHTSILGTDFVCCALPLDGAPSDLVQLFAVHTIPATQAGKAH